MELIIYIILILLCFSISYVFNLWMLAAKPSLLMDHPNYRSMHSEPTLRGGGLGLILAVLIAGLFIMSFSQDVDILPTILLGFVMVAVISMIDDFGNVDWRVRLCVHFIAAMLLVYKGLTINTLSLGPWSFVLPTYVDTIITVLAVVWFINLYNFMDGMDGLAGSMTFFGFFTLGVIALVKNQFGIASLCLGAASASVGFLHFNFPPAKIFMGDVGAASIGYLAVCVIFWGHSEHVFSWWIGLVAFSPFIYDATFTLVKRFIRKEKILKPHQKHYFQRIVRLTGGQTKTLAITLLLMFVCMCLSWLGVFVHWYYKVAILVFLLCIYAIIPFYIYREEKKRDLR